MIEIWGDIYYLVNVIPPDFRAARMEYERPEGLNFGFTPSAFFFFVLASIPFHSFISESSSK